MSTQRYDIGAWELNGVTGLAVAEGGSCIGVRLARPHAAIGMHDDRDALLILCGPFLRSPDGTYGRCAWRIPVTEAGVRHLAGRPRAGNDPATFAFAPGDAVTVTLEWARVGPAEVHLRYSSDGPLAALLTAAGSFAPAVVVEGDARGGSLRQDGLQVRVALAPEAEAVWRVGERDHLEARWQGLPRPEGDRQIGWKVAIAPHRPLHVSLRPGEAASAAAPDGPAIAAAIEAAAARYDRQRMRSSGAAAGAAEAVAELAAYGHAYDPKRRRIQMTINRTWGGVGSPGLVFGWDNVLMAYIAAWEDPALAAATLEHILGVYTERGIANGPTQRNLVIPIAACRTLAVIGDEALERRCLPHLLAFMRFWFADRGDGVPHRDPNRDGLIEPGTSKDPAGEPLGRMISDAMDETGYDDLPTYSAGFTEGRRGLLADGVGFDWATGCLDVTVVCQNSLYIAACRILAPLARRLGAASDAEWLDREAERVARRMEERLRDDAGRFRDRLATGAFSPHRTCREFFPLLAGLDDQRLRDDLRRRLLDPAEFGGVPAVPTVSRSDPAFCHDSIDGAGNYWRGNCWPPTTHLVVQAARAAGWSDVSADLSLAVLDQFMGPWRRWTHAYENMAGRDDQRMKHYPPMWGGREVRYVWAALLPLTALEEAFEPEADGVGFRVGNPRLRQDLEWDGFVVHGERLRAIAGPRRTVLAGSDWAIESQPGLAFRRWRRTRQGMTVSFADDRPAVIRLRMADPGAVEVRLDGLAVAASRTGEWLEAALPRARGILEVSLGCPTRP
jgi:hypothetical protein